MLDRARLRPATELSGSGNSCSRFAPFRWLIQSLDGIPIDREGLGLAGLKETLRRLKRGELVLIFPEGTRTRDGAVKASCSKPGIQCLWPAEPECRYCPSALKDRSPPGLVGGLFRSPQLSIFTLVSPFYQRRLLASRNATSSPRLNGGFEHVICRPGEGCWGRKAG